MRKDREMLLMALGIALACLPTGMQAQTTTTQFPLILEHGTTVAAPGSLLTTTQMQLPAPEVRVEALPLPSESLEEEYNAYRITVTNPAPDEIVLMSAGVENAITQEAAYEEVSKSLIGPTSFMGVGGLVFTAYRRYQHNDDAQDAVQPFATRLPDRTYISPGGIISFRTLVPEEASPVIALNYGVAGTEATVHKTYSNLPIQPARELPPEMYPKSLQHLFNH